MNLSPVVDALISEFEKKPRYTKEGGDFSVSKTVSMLARVYEKARNAVEFRAEHLIRRAAIERILKRRILLNGNASGSMAESLILELMWAKYIDSSQIDDQKLATIQDIIDRYMALKHLKFNNTSYEGVTWELVLGIASAEIEETIIPAEKSTALTNFFYQAIRQKIQLHSKDEQWTNILTYIAVDKGFAQSDDELIYFHLVCMNQPEWIHTKAADVPKVADQFIISLQTLTKAMSDKPGESLFRYVRRNTPPFLLLRDFFNTHGKDARDIISHPEKLDTTLRDLAHSRYQRIGVKIRRSIVRSVIYIFFTKMIFALALEVPVDLFIVKRVDYLPLAINTLFPPILLMAVAGFLRPPGEENTKRLIGRINKILYHFDELKDEKDTYTSTTRVKRPILTAVFSVLYLGAFVVSFGFISYILTKLHFNIASQIIFVFFVTLASFFAYRIRRSAKEYEIVERQRFFAPVFDFFFLPILRVGHILSSEIAKINIFIVLFDFILEAPLKAIFELLEEWIRFMRTKKEEII